MKRYVILEDINIENLYERLENYPDYKIHETLHIITDGSTMAHKYRLVITPKNWIERFFARGDNGKKKQAIGR